MNSLSWRHNILCHITQTWLPVIDNYIFTFLGEKKNLNERFSPCFSILPSPLFFQPFSHFSAPNIYV